MIEGEGCCFELNADTRLDNGHGADGAIHLVEHQGRPAVVKLFYSGRTSSYLREIGAYRTLPCDLRWPALCESGLTPEGRRYLVLERILGMTVMEAVWPNRFKCGVSPDVVLGFCLKVLDTLGAIHRGGFSHGDFHPGNVGLRWSPNGLVAYVIDFSFSSNEFQNMRWDVCRMLRALSGAVFTCAVDGMAEEALKSILDEVVMLVGVEYEMCETPAEDAAGFIRGRAREEGIDLNALLEFASAQNVEVVSFG